MRLLLRVYKAKKKYQTDITKTLNFNKSFFQSNQNLFGHTPPRYQMVLLCYPSLEEIAELT